MGERGIVVCRLLHVFKFFGLEWQEFSFSAVINVSAGGEEGREYAGAVFQSICFYQLRQRDLKILNHVSSGNLKKVCH